MITKRKTTLKNFISELIAQNVRIYLQVQSALDQCSNEIKEIIRDMIDVFESPESTEDERNGALYTIVEALFLGIGSSIRNATKKHAGKNKRNKNEKTKSN
jgi:hypothetical protein